MQAIVSRKPAHMPLYVRRAPRCTEVVSSGEDLGDVPDELPLAAVVVTAIALCLSRRDEHR